MMWVRCILRNLMLFPAVGSLAAAAQSLPQHGEFAESAFTIADPGSLFLIGLGLMAVGIVGTRVLRG